MTEQQLRITSGGNRTRRTRTETAVLDQGNEASDQPAAASDPSTQQCHKNLGKSRMLRFARAYTVQPGIYDAGVLSDKAQIL